MREVFAHDAVLEMPPDSDDRAPGAAVTAALCGSWTHEPPCPLAPHHTNAARVGNELRAHTIFAVDPALETEVRRRIDRALSMGNLAGRPEAARQWVVQNTRSGTVADDELPHAERLRLSD